MRAIIPAWSEPRVPEGVYINFPARRYFLQPAMGSSDWTTIDRAKEGWWMTSRHNPDYVQPKSEALSYGSALHALLLEGVAAYERAFAIEPDKRRYPGLVSTEDEIKARLTQAGVSLAGTSKFKKGDWNTQMLLHLPDVPCWGNLMEEFLAKAGERERISATADRMLRHMLHVATDPTRRDNVDIRRFFADDPEHPPLVELSVFAEVDGIWRRWRFDKMLPAATMDLKSLGAWSGRPLDWEAGDVTARRRWEIQRADYHDGRHVAYRLIKEGKVYGGNLAQRAYLERIAEEYPHFVFIWLVYQKPDPAGRAAVLMPIWDEEDSDLHNWGRNKLAKAKAFYRARVAEFGLDEPWARVERLHYTDPNRQPSIPYPHWIADDNPTVPEAYAVDTDKEDSHV